MSIVGVRKTLIKMKQDICDIPKMFSSDYILSDFVIYEKAYCANAGAWTKTVFVKHVAKPVWKLLY